MRYHVASGRMIGGKKGRAIMKLYHVMLARPYYVLGFGPKAFRRESHNCKASKTDEGVEQQVIPCMFLKLPAK